MAIYKLIFQLNMVIFHSYVSLPEGMIHHVIFGYRFFRQQLITTTCSSEDSVMFDHELSGLCL